jgi:hypothetical protein
MTKIYTNNIPSVDNCAYQSVDPGGKYWVGLAWSGHTGDPGLNLIFPNSVGRVCSHCHGAPVTRDALLHRGD